MADKKVHDKFCWECHNILDSFSALECSNCVRSFDQCHELFWEDFDKESWLCPVCAKMESNANAAEPNELAMLRVIVDRILGMKLFDCLIDPYESTSIYKPNEALVHLIKLTTFKEKLDSYKSLEEYLTDVRWIVHNCTAMYTKDHENCKAARALYDYSITEIKILRKCAECYANANNNPSDWFAMACNEVHLIIWAKLNIINYWPAKLMSIDGQSVNVSFFGNHTHTSVLAKNCLLYTQENPNASSNLSDLHKAALDEADLYLANISESFGSFHFAEERTVLDPELLQQYILQMISGTHVDAQNGTRADTATASCSSVVECSGEPAAKRSRTSETDDKDDQSQITQSDGDDSGIDLSGISTQNTEPTSSTLNRYQRNASTDADSSEVNQGLEEIDDQFDNMVKKVKEGYKSQVIALKKEISALKDAHAKDIAELKETQQALEKALAEKMAANDRVATLHMVVDDKDKVILDLKSEIDAEKLHTSQSQRMEEEYRHKLNEIETNVLAIIRRDGSSSESQHT